MLREVFLSTLYSSSRLFSSNATRRSSFSTLITILFPVLRVGRPKIFRTFSNIKLGTFRDQERDIRREVVHPLDRFVYCGNLRRTGGGVGGGGACRLPPNNRSKKFGFRGGGVMTGCARGARALLATLPWSSASGSTSGAPPPAAI